MMVEIPSPVWVLYLNNMQSPKAEMQNVVSRANTREELVALLEREAVPAYVEPGYGPYGETKWHKSFRKGGPLEWFNPPDSIHPSFRCYDFEQMLRETVQNVMNIPPA